MRNKYYHSIKCSNPECKEYGHFSAGTRNEYSELIKRHKSWTCCRHTKPNEVLSSENNTLESSQFVVETSYGKFWSNDSQGKPGSGFTFGPGFKAYADDFSVGTKLTVTARIEIPSIV